MDCSPLNLAVVLPSNTTGTRELLDGVADFAAANPSTKVRVFEVACSEMPEIDLADFDGVVSCLPSARNTLALQKTTVFWSLFSCFQPKHADELARRLCNLDTTKDQIVFVSDSGVWGTGEFVHSIANAACKVPFVLDGDAQYHSKILMRRGADRQLSEWLIGQENSLIVCSDSKVAQRVLRAKQDRTLSVLCLHDDAEALLEGISAVRIPFSRIACHALASIQYRITGKSRVPRVLFPWRINQRSSTQKVEHGLARTAYEIIERDAFQGITCEEVVRQLGVSPRTLSRQFQSQYGITPSRHIRNLRLEHARVLLRETNKRISDIARECGFSEASKFCVFYKRETGMTPTEYRAVPVS